MLVAGDGEGSGRRRVGRRRRRQVARPLLRVVRRDRAALQRELDQGADLVVTDTNRQRAARHWGAVRDMTGYTERAGAKALVADPGDKPLEPFPGAGDDTKTVTEQRAASRRSWRRPMAIRSSSRPRPGRRWRSTATRFTAWTEGSGGRGGRGEAFVIDLASPVTTEQVTLVQPQTGIRDRSITGATLTFDGKDAIRVTLGPESRTVAGQVVTFPRRTFHKLEIAVDAVESPTNGLGPVGFAEVKIPGASPVDELVRLPVDLLRAAGKSSLRTT